MSAYARARTLPSYQPIALKLPDVWVFYDARDLSEDGRAGGYIRVSQSTNPIDVPVVWDQRGDFQPLPMGQPYSQAYVLGFDSQGGPVGAATLDAHAYVVPGLWSSSGFQLFRDYGYGGGVLDGVPGTWVGDTGDPDPVGGLYIARVTVWDANGNRTRVRGLDEPRRFSRVRAMNDNGVYVGYTYDKAVVPRRVEGFLGHGSDAHILSFPGFDVRNAVDVNNTNWVIGGWTPDGATDRGFVGQASGTDARDLGTLAGHPEVFPMGINDAGEIVGAASLGVTFDVALYWKPGATEPVDLNTLVSIPGEPRLVEAMDINNAGQILTRGFNGYYILTPVPEPQAVVLGGLGVIALAKRRTRRH